MKEKRRHSILKLPPDENSKPLVEKKQRVSFGTANQLITYTNPDSQKRDSSSFFLIFTAVSYRKESVPFNDAKEHNALPKRSPLCDITKKRGGKSATHSFIDSFLSNPAALYSDDDNSTMEITGGAINESFLRIEQKQQTKNLTKKNITPFVAQPNRYTFESPASEGLIRTGKMLSSLLGDDEDSVSSLFEKTDEDEFFDEKTQTGNAYDSKRAGATDEQTLMYINLAKKGEKEKVALLSAGQNGAEDKKRVSGAKVKLEEVMAFLEFREDPKETKELINRDGKEKSPVSNETQSPSSKNENEIFESIFINGLEKRNLFHKAITDLRTKVNESLKLKESSIQTILKCGNEGERTENKLVNLMLKFKEDKNQLEKFKHLVKQIKLAETQKAQNQITHTKNIISKALILALKPKITRLEQILVDFNAKNSELFNEKLDLSKAIKILSSCRWAEVEKSIAINSAEIAALEAKKAEMAAQSLKIAECSQSEQILCKTERIYSILCKKTGVVFAKRAKNGATGRVHTNVLLARGTIKADIKSILKENGVEMTESVELSYGGEKKIIDFSVKPGSGSLATDNLLAVKSDNEIAGCSAIKCFKALGRIDLLMFKMVDAFPWKDCFKNVFKICN